MGGASKTVGVSYGQKIDGGPYVDPNPKGRNEDGSFTPFQKVMGVVASIGGLGTLIGPIVSFLGATQVGFAIFGISAIVSIVSLIISGLGGAT